MNLGKMHNNLQHSPTARRTGPPYAALQSACVQDVSFHDLMVRSTIM